jgi:hypothetical protein
LRTSSRIPGLLLIARDTVAIVTPHASAISRIVIFFFKLMPAVFA